MKTLVLISQDEYDLISQRAETMNAQEKIHSLLEWNKHQKFYETDVVSSQFLFFGKEYSHYLVTLKSSNGKLYAGHGRSEDPYLALLKAFSEAFERAAMSFYFQTPIDPKYFIQLIYSSDISLAKSRLPIKFCPGKHMHNSNGWAVHSNPVEATDRALKEAIERHSLQLRYWTEGLSFLKPFKTHNFNGYQIELSATDSGIGRMQTMISSFRDSKHPGMLFGHSTFEGIEEDSWVHPTIEAYQIAEAIRHSSGSGVIENIFDEIQQSFWFEDRFVFPAKAGEDSLPKVQNLDFNLVVLDLKKMLNLPFNLYASWTFSDWIMPLYLESTLAHEDRSIFSEQFYYITGRRKDLYQTPFI